MVTEDDLNESQILETHRGKTQIPGDGNPTQHKRRSPSKGGLMRREQHQLATFEDIIAHLGFGRFQIKNYVLISAMMFFHPFQIFIIPFIGQNNSSTRTSNLLMNQRWFNKTTLLDTNCTMMRSNLTLSLSNGTDNQEDVKRRFKRQQPVDPLVFTEIENVFDSFLPPDAIKMESNVSRSSNVLNAFVKMLNPNYTINDCILKLLKSQKSKFTIADEWNLTGPREYMVPLASSIFMFGTIFGSFIFALISDVYGRRVSLCCSVSLHAVSSVLPALWSPNYIVFVVYRFCQGISHAGNFMSHMVMITELLPTDKKFLITAVSTFFYTLGHVVLAVLAYLLTSWKHLQLATGLFSCIYIGFLYFIDESLHWLMAKHKTRAAAKLIVKAARINRLDSGKGKHYFNYQQILGSLKREIEGGSQRGQPTYSDQPTTTNPLISESTDNNYLTLDTAISSNYEPGPSTPHKTKFANLAQRSSEYWTRIKVRYGMIDKSKYLRARREAQSQIHSTTPNQDLHPTNDVRHLRFLDLLMVPVLRRRTFFAALSTFFLYQLQMALILSIHLLPGDQYINFSLSGLAEIPINIIGIYALKIGRRKPLILFNIITALAILARWKIPLVQTTSSIAINVFLYLVARSFNGGAFLITFLYISEIYPTEIRNSGYGLNNAISRAGYVISPFLSYLEKYHEAYFPTLMVIFSILSSIFMTYLPATKNKPLPRTLEDIK